MPLFRCILVESSGASTRVDITAIDIDSALRAVSGKDRIPVSIEEMPISGCKTRQSRKKREAVLEFTEMMHLLTDSGLSVRDALDVASTIGGTKGAGLLAAELAETVQKGTGFAQAIEAKNDFFTPIYRGLVSVGDRTGSVERIFPRLASYLREMKALRDKIMGALSYPLMVIVVTILGSVGLSLFVIPRMEVIFTGFGGDAAEKVRDNIRGMEISIIAILSGFLALIIAFTILTSLAQKTPILAKVLDRAKLTLPVIGPFISAWETLNFAFAMETLAAGGVAVEDAIEEASRVVNNEAYRSAALEVREEILKGHSLSLEFRKHREFPEYMSQWMVVGERSGNTERVFAQIRRYFQAEVDRATTRFTVLLEPALIIIIGILLLVLVTGIVIPLFSLYGTIL